MGGSVLGVLAMIAIYLATVAADVVNDYTGSLSLQAAGITVRRPVIALINGAAAFAFSAWFLYAPGALYDKVRGPNVFFQPSEKYDPTAVSEGTYDWYLVNFGGNGATAYSAYNAFTQPVGVDEMSVRLGWWNAVPIKPFASSSTINLSADCAAAS